MAYREDRVTGQLHAVLSKADSQCATFFWPNRPVCYVGYRFVEHRPEALPQALQGIDQQPTARFGEGPAQVGTPRAAEAADPWGKGWTATYAETSEDNAIQLRFASFMDGSADASVLDNDGEAERELHFGPAENGMWMCMRMTAHVDIPGAYGVQQCLRLGGVTNQEWRQRIAMTTALSEFDRQARVDPNRSLTWARRDGTWLRFPVQHATYHTPPGQSLAGDKTDGAVDYGLIVRQSADEQCSAGMYWERTACIANRHPADCVHAVVDFGPLAQGESRTVRGRFYFVDGPKEELFAAWMKDFA
jgi:hypothetical protein